MKKRYITHFILSTFLLLLTFSFMTACSRSNQEEKKSQEKSVIKKENPEEATDYVEEQIPPEASTEKPKEEIMKNPINFHKLQKKCKDIYGWIQIPDTVVDYPLLHVADEDKEIDYYLEHTPEGDEGLPGSIYTQYDCNPSLAKDPVTVVYGHNMRNESMFGSLKHFQEKKYRKAHPRFYIYTPKYMYTYQIAFAVTYSNKHILDSYDGCHDKEDYQNFLTSIKEEAVEPKWYSKKVDLSTEDQLVILSTCNGNHEQRFLVGGKLIEKKKLK